MATIKNIKNAKTTKNYFFFKKSQYEETEETYYREMIDKIDHPCYDGMTIEEFLDDPVSIGFII